ncbi:GNAT family N-acetyltransferase [Paenibacillus sp. JCM 10914]|uniref:hypothetical protein n=1 Tax=Paenibacillus sp. JCM 10914 TaxID=1236974 RepID=UPI0003CC8026|nr:hypothetical protein [Paenibacillus sp. JCM 10914]GAE05614.1 hypothetical protein JCM10914_1724 [Paenibacillus sp. JCM 10914]
MKITFELPTIQEYIHLQAKAGRTTVDESLVERALSHTLLSILVRNDQNELIAMARVVGDGALYYHIVDHIVTSSARDISDQMLEKLLSALYENASTSTTKAEIAVMTDLNGIKMYQNAGFKLVYPDRYGMIHEGAAERPD